MSTRPARTWGQRLVLALSAFIALGLVTSAVALVGYENQVSQINRIAGQGVLTQATEATGPLNFLVVGVDNAEGLDPNDPVLRGRFEASLLSDTIMVVRVDPALNKAWLLSIPRDLWVTIAGTGTKGKINSALALGGPQTLIDTIQTELNVPINHYVQVNFAGFRNLVSVIGGVPVWFDREVRDENTGLTVEVPGCVNLEGEQALAFVRSRYFEVFDGGEWISDPTGDSGRIARQQTFIRAALNRAVAQGARNPFEMQRLIEATDGEVVLDDTLSLDALIDLGERFRDFNVESFEVVTLPVDNGYAGAAAVGYLRTAEAQPLLAVFRGQTLLGTPNALARVEVLNGSGQAGQAAFVAETLVSEGFTVVGTDDAPGYTGPTVIRYAPGALLEAVTVARYIGRDALIQEAPEGEITGETRVVLLTGSDFKGLLVPSLEFADFSRYVEQAKAEYAAALAAGDESAGEGLTVEDVTAGSVTLPAVTTTTITRDLFVPRPPEGVECG